MRDWTDCVFDLYGTLVDIRTDEGLPQLWEGLADLYSRYGAVYAPEELHSGYLRLVRNFEGEARRADDWESHPEIQIEPVFETLFREKGVHVDGDTVSRVGIRFRELSTLRLRLYPGAEDLLEALRNAGKRVWLLSNAQALFTRWELERLGIRNSFDGIYLSSDYGRRKPDPAFYLALLKGEGIRPSQAVMVGNDGHCDILGARALGLSTIYLRSEISPEEPMPPADFALDHVDLRRVGEILLGASSVEA